MSTRSSIAVQFEDGHIEACYCHFDGYLDGVGKTLLKSHNSFSKAKELISLGDLSSVDEKVTAYSRDKGEDFETTKPHKYDSVLDYMNRVEDEIGDNGYRYFYNGTTWQVWGQGVNNARHTLVPLNEAIESDGD